MIRGSAFGGSDLLGGGGYYNIHCCCILIMYFIFLHIDAHEIQDFQMKEKKWVTGSQYQHLHNQKCR